MHVPVRTIRSVAGVGAALGLLLLTGGPASAHVGIEGEVPAGGSGTITFRVPTERDDASTIELAVQIPEEVPLGSLSVQPKPGWTIETTTRTLDEPVEVFGEEITEVVDTITWTAEGEGIGPGQFDTFAVRGGPFPEDATEVAFPAIQTYDSGEEVAWIEETVEGEEEPEHPAPVLTLAAPEDEDGAAATATPADDDAEQAAAVADDDDGGSDGLAIAGLVVGLVGLGTAVVALLTARRKPTAA